MKPSKATISNRLTRFQHLCRENNFPLTPQKTAIFHYLASTDTHPSAQQIHQDLQHQFPSLSFATVYKNLNKFLALNLIKVIELKDGNKRYDANLDPHQHIINLKNGKIRDIDYQYPIKIPREIKREQLDHIALNFYIK